MTALRETVALTPCHWCGNDNPAQLHTGSSYLEQRAVIECTDEHACDTRTLATETAEQGSAA